MSTIVAQHNIRMEALHAIPLRLALILTDLGLAVRSHTFFPAFTNSFNLEIIQKLHVHANRIFLATNALSQQKIATLNSFRDFAVFLFVEGRKLPLVSAVFFLSFFSFFLFPFPRVGGFLKTV
jgi:hypothetical protein